MEQYSQLTAAIRHDSTDPAIPNANSSCVTG